MGRTGQQLGRAFCKLSLMQVVVGLSSGWGGPRGKLTSDGAPSSGLPPLRDGRGSSMAWAMPAVVEDGLSNGGGDVAHVYSFYKVSKQVHNGAGPRGTASETSAVEGDGRNDKPKR